MKQYIVDAFAEELFTGNPAAVLPCKTMPTPEIMLKIAIENNYSETAFVVKTGEGKYDLKWFTPGGEIDLCGHATLATAYIVSRFVDYGIEKMSFKTLSGELSVTRDGEQFTLDFPVGKTKPISVTEAIMRATDGMAKEAYFDGGDLVVIVDDEKKLQQFVPNDELISKLEGMGLVVSAPSKQYDFVSRCFYPKLNVSEDPVTGRAHTFMAPIWAEKLGKRIMTAKQISKRGGVITVCPTKDRVLLSGKAQLFMEGEIPFEL